ncbi:hypothetical protein AKJ16_DCAP00542 [Drosera capensis]
MMGRSMQDGAYNEPSTSPCYNEKSRPWGKPTEDESFLVCTNPNEERDENSKFSGDKCLRHAS